VTSDPVVVVYQVLTLAYLAAMAAMYLLSGRPAPRATGGLLDGIVALASANLLIPLSLLPQRDLLPYPVLIGMLLVANVLSWWALLRLRASFSLTPEARRLVTSGPYRFVRHPLYLAGFIVSLGLLGTIWSAPAVALFALYMAATVLRARAEDRVLRAAFPAEYAEYQRATGAFMPRAPL
jgi:protein-S-isoprenylcysteine O-methyltransferase Ste14